MFEFGIHVLVMAAIFGIGAVSLNFQAGSARLLNFGQVVFVGLGAYATGILGALGVHPVLGVAAGMALGAVAGAAIGLLNRNLGPEYWALSTLAIAELLRLVALNELWLTGGAQGIAGISRPFAGIAEPWRGLLTLGSVGAVLAVCVVLLSHIVERTQFGRVLRLQRDHPGYAASLGHDVTRIKIKALALAGAIGALSGSLFAHYFAYVSPDQLIALETFLLWTMIVVGGLGNPYGAVLGAVIIQALYAGTPFIKDVLDLDGSVAASLRIFLIGGVLIGSLLFMSRGLVPEKRVRLDARDT